MEKSNLQHSYLFEVSWEVCNKVGGIHTVVSTKALNMSKEYGNNHILIGPDVWRNTERNPEFIDDQRLFRSWRAKAESEGLRIKVGRWNVIGTPIVILVDFSTFMSQKDTITAKFWESYKLDSISGQWDYIEPLLFGFAAGKVIESFVHFNISMRSHVVAQFHEWMTGSGLLYLKQAMPQVGTVFTTHATVLGRCIAGNNLPLYGEMGNYVPEELAHRFNVVAKQSLEKLSAQEADAFTTVSDITAVECRRFLGKNVDFVTPNGFEPGFTPATEEEHIAKYNAARDSMRGVAERILGTKPSDDAIFVGIGGRYEFKNKGIDVFIDALGLLAKEEGLKREVVAFIMIPAGHGEINRPEESGNHILTHYLHDPGNDPILNRMAACGLTNAPESKVKVIFVPCYLQGDDGVFNLPYYDLLIGMDMSAFPSYYEPWGYTPLESVAFSVPTITTTVAGFGLWVNDHAKDEHSGVKVITRDDNNGEAVSGEISKILLSYAGMNCEEVTRMRESAKETSKIALWDNFIEYYKKAYDVAIDKANGRLQNSDVQVQDSVSYMEKQMTVNNPNWVSVRIHRNVPERLKGLEELSKNLWWCWNDEAREVFRLVDYDAWKRLGHNPIAMLDSVTMARLEELEKDEEFMAKVDKVYADFKAYMAEKDKATGGGVSYFSMEYALHTSLKIYSGGLGVLAGDYLKEASDKNTKMTAVGLLYRYGYFTQKISAAGDQEAVYDAQDFMKLPVEPVVDSDGNTLLVSLPLPGRTMYARVWRVNVGRVELYLLDTDFGDNIKEDQSVTHHLYGGDWENRLKQEILLGCGGIQALRKMGIENDTYHCNEGHAAFIGLERMRNYIQDEKLSFNEALEVVRSSSLFTTHTPVPAGHDAFEEDLLHTYMAHYADLLKISWEQLLGLGKINVKDPGEKFSMSFLAANLSQEMNGVSMLHGKVSRDIFKPMWPGYTAEESHVGYVTNGVHFDTWTNEEWKEVYAKAFGKEFFTHHYDKSCFEGIYSVSDEKVMEIRNKLRARLIRHIKEMLANGMTTTYFTPRQILKVIDTLRDDVLTFGFARRFATYKRAHLLFSNLERLDEIVNNPQRPVQFIFAGKAHPADKAGQDLIKRIVEISKYPQFIGKILFLPNYDMDLSKFLVQGVDVWMNMPTRPQEASGTSGEKAAMNGVMHFSVLDGWWVEGYRADSGWMLPQERTYDNQAAQDELDSEMVYNIIEEKIAPCFYAKKKGGISSEWVSFVKNTIAKVASNFTTNRMLIDYERQYYNPLSERYHKMIENHYAMAFEIAEWKAKVTREWDNIELVDFAFPDRFKQNIALGKSYCMDITIELGELDIDDISIELVQAEREHGELKIVGTYQFVPVKQEDGKGYYHIDNTPEVPGEIMMTVRLYPNGAAHSLPHRMDFPLVKWI